MRSCRPQPSLHRPSTKPSFSWIQAGKASMSLCRCGRVRELSAAEQNGGPENTRPKPRVQRPGWGPTPDNTRPEARVRGPVRDPAVLLQERLALPLRTPLVVPAPGPRRGHSASLLRTQLAREPMPRAGGGLHRGCSLSPTSMSNLASSAHCASEVRSPSLLRSQDAEEA
jgi:hypothetical protein